MSKLFYLFFISFFVISTGCNEEKELPAAKKNETQSTAPAAPGQSSNATIGTKPATVLAADHMDAKFMTAEDFKFGIGELKERITKLIDVNRNLVTRVEDLRKTGCFLRRPLTELEVVLFTEREPEPKYHSDHGNGSSLTIDLGAWTIGPLKASDSKVPEGLSGRPVLKYSKVFEEGSKATLNDIQKLVVIKPIAGEYFKEVINTYEECSSSAKLFPLVEAGFFKTLFHATIGDSCMDTYTVTEHAMRERDQVFLYRMQMFATTTTTGGKAWRRKIFDEDLDGGIRLNNLRSQYGFFSFVGETNWHMMSNDKNCEEVHQGEVVGTEEIYNWISNNIGGGFPDCVVITDLQTGRRECLVDENAKINEDVVSWDDELEYTREAFYKKHLDAKEPTTENDNDNNTASLVSHPERQLNYYLAKEPQVITPLFFLTGYGKAESEDALRGEWEYLKGMYDNLQSQFFYMHAEKDILTNEGCFYQMNITSMKLKMIADVYHNFGGEFHKVAPLDSAPSFTHTKPSPLTSVTAKGRPRGLKLSLGFTTPVINIPFVDDMLSEKSNTYVLPPAFYRGKQIKDIKFIRLTKRGLGRQYDAAMKEWKAVNRAVFGGKAEEKKGDDWVHIEEDTIKLDTFELHINGLVAYGNYEMNWVLSSASLQYSDFSIQKNPWWRRQSGRKDCDVIEMVEVSK